MKKFQIAVLLISIIIISSIGFTSASAEILNPRMVHAIMSNIVSAYGKTYHLQVDNKTYNIYYGFNVTYANATNILFIPEQNSMQINLKEVTETDAMWIQFPQNLIPTENNNFLLYVDGQEEKYEYSTSGHSIIMGFMIPTDATLVEIKGTNAVPEYPFAITILIIATFSAVLIQKIRLSKVNA